ncbi:hypothetical protein DACRYDRAFT_25127 [Dacryopinax primogenitus]|uniref:Uncharacterized protein n=1 Tax=Dacryopinax primogenitus (strain DJM 731) TaxID=1858805 RepID=M5FPV6_DACPD|nr:uncharacterized protein DACRYDRAFT_25127 [Dacryopinax primogenitus]EJT97343.1 hypothetical protein DACRYDRAFT_25127 [Dacryopinax primogenitus]
MEKFDAVGHDSGQDICRLQRSGIHDICFNPAQIGAMWYCEVSGTPLAFCAIPMRWLNWASRRECPTFSTRHLRGAA